MMHLYKFETSETDHIAARDETEARAYFRVEYPDEHYEGDFHETVGVTEVPQEQWGLMVINDDDAPGGKTTAAAIIGDATVERGAFLVASSVW